MTLSSYDVESLRKQWEIKFQPFYPLASWSPWYIHLLSSLLQENKRPRGPRTVELVMASGIPCYIVSAFVNQTSVCINITIEVSYILHPPLRQVWGHFYMLKDLHVMLKDLQVIILGNYENFKVEIGEWKMRWILACPKIRIFQNIA